MIYMEEEKKPQVEIYTDGACSGNPGKGGYGAVLRYKKPDGNYISKELSEGFANTTNNRMELLAPIIALETLKKPCKVTLTSDSKYLIDAIEKKWLDGWQAKNWKTAGKKPVKNIDLWKRLISAMEKHEIKFVWVKGHAGHEYNERCDQLAVNAYNGEDLKVDEGFNK